MDYPDKRNDEKNKNSDPQVLNLVDFNADAKQKKLEKSPNGKKTKNSEKDQKNFFFPDLNEKKEEILAKTPENEALLPVENTNDFSIDKDKNLAKTDKINEKTPQKTKENSKENLKNPKNTKQIFESGDVSKQG